MVLVELGDTPVGCLVLGENRLDGGVVVGVGQVRIGVLPPGVLEEWNAHHILVDVLHDLEMEAVADAVQRRKLLHDAHRGRGIEGETPELAVCFRAGAVLPARDELRKHMGADAVECFAPLEQIDHPLVDALHEDFALILAQQVHPVEILAGDERVPGFRAGDGVAGGPGGRTHAEELAHVARKG